MDRRTGRRRSLFFIKLSSDGAAGEVDAVLEGGPALIIEKAERIVVLEVDVVQELVAILVLADGLAPDEDVVLVGLGVCDDHGIVADVHHCRREVLRAVLVTRAGYLESGHERAFLVQGAEIQAGRIGLGGGIFLQPPGYGVVGEGIGLGYGDETGVGVDAVQQPGILRRRQCGESLRALAFYLQAILAGHVAAIEHGVCTGAVDWVVERCDVLDVLIIILAIYIIEGQKILSIFLY